MIRLSCVIHLLKLILVVEYPSSTLVTLGALLLDGRGCTWATALCGESWEVCITHLCDSEQPKVSLCDHLSEERVERDPALCDCRSSFTTLPPPLLQEQPRCGSFLERAQVSRVRYGWTWWTLRFTWFGPPERITLRPRENESCIAQALTFFLVALCGLESSNAHGSLL
jgi:hypothetical protein